AHQRVRHSAVDDRGAARRGDGEQGGGAADRSGADGPPLPDRAARDAAVRSRDAAIVRRAALSKLFYHRPIRYISIMQSSWWTQLPNQPPPSREPFDDLGPAQRFFVGLQKNFAFDLSFTQSRFRDVAAWRAEALPALRNGLVLPARTGAPAARLRRRIEQ